MASMLRCCMVIKSFLRKIIPKSLLRFYHLLLVELAALFYGYPSRKMIVIGITGTKGKSSTAYLTAKILEEAGYKVGLTSTVLFKIGAREWLNPYKMTMLGRFRLQKMLREMVGAGCGYAVVETSSEGILQNRHRGIAYDVAVFTNLSPEHLEAHGSYANYRAAKAELFKSLKKKSLGGKEIPRIIIANADDQEAEYYLGFPADKKFTFTLENKVVDGIMTISAADIILGADGSSFRVDGQNFSLGILGRFNIYNALAAVTVAVSQNVTLASAAAALAKIDSIPGRFEIIEAGQPFKIIIDYAHEPASMEEMFAATNLLAHQRIIHVFGGTGGGRDKGKRAAMGKISAANADYIIITNDDPYDEDQNKIADDIILGIKDAGHQNFEKILDRRKAIQKALALADDNDLVLVTGKGAEQAMMVGEKKIPWDDRKIVIEILNQH